MIRNSRMRNYTVLASYFGLAILVSDSANAACGKISACPDATVPISGAELVPIVQSGVTKKIRADNLFGSTFTIGNQTPIAASKMKVDNQIQVSSFPLENEGGLWASQAYAFVAFNKEMTSTTVPSPGTGGVSGGPLTTVFIKADQNNSGGDAVALLTDCAVHNNDGACWGANIIARGTGTGINMKLVGLEIDIDPIGADHVTNGCGLCINGFSDPAMTIAAIQTGGIGGGKFANGIVFDGLVGAALTTNVGAGAMQYFIYTANSTFSTETIQLGNLQKISWLGTSGTPGKTYLDAANTIRVVPGNGTLAYRLRNNADAADLFTVSSGGNLAVTGTFQVTQASPAAAAACTAGQIVADTGFIYTCSASGAWKRVAVTGGY